MIGNTKKVAYGVASVGGLFILVSTILLSPPDFSELYVIKKEKTYAIAGEWKKSYGKTHGIIGIQSRYATAKLEIKLNYPSQIPKGFTVLIEAKPVIQHIDNSQLKSRKEPKIVTRRRMVNGIPITLPEVRYRYVPEASASQVRKDAVQALKMVRFI